MDKSEIKILIVEDEAALGKSLHQWLQKEGFESLWVDNSKEALSIFTSQVFHVVILDCMLPQMNGLELAKKMRQASVEDFKIIFTTGIFKDKAFSREALQAVDGARFIYKPYELSEFTDSICSLFAADLDTQKTPVCEFFIDNQRSPKEKLDQLQNLDSLHGYELPKLLSALSLTQSSGSLNIISDQSGTSSIHFDQGNICQVHTEDKTSYFGILLVENGFATVEDINKSLSLQHEKPLGQKLVDTSSLSPHAIRSVLKQQMGIRISKIIQDENLNIHLLLNSTPKADIFLTPNDLIELFHDWTLSKINTKWLNSYYQNWLEHPLLLTKNKKLLTTLKNFDLTTLAPGLFKYANGQHSLQDILELSFPTSEVDTLKSLHFMLLCGLFQFKPKPKNNRAFEARIKSLKRTLKLQKEQNHFEILGLTKDAKASEINKSYMRLAKSLHPDKISPEAPEELKQLAHEVFTHISMANQVLSDNKQREKYRKFLELGKAEDILKSEEDFEKAYDLIRKNKFKESLLILQTLNNHSSPRADLPVYLAWAMIKTQESPSQQTILQISQILNKVPPEHRHAAHFLFAKGLFYQLTGEIKKATTNIKNSLALDPNFTEAKRELLIMEQNSTLGTDFKKAVGSLFHRNRK